MSLLPVLTPAQAATWDEQAVHAGIPLELLMESAGRAVAAVLGDHHPDELRRGTLILIGTGNNGGDGWVLARALHRLGLPVWAVPVPGSPGPLAAAVAARARADGVRELDVGGPWPESGLVVDALLGTGAVGPPRGAVAQVLERLHDLTPPLVAIDGPTGLDLGTGTSHGSPRAGLTITFGGPRRGHLLGRESTGHLVVVDIGHPAADPAWPRLVDDGHAASWLPPLGARDHKGTRGRVLIIGGTEGMSGAVRLAARAALAAGAGIVQLATSPESAVRLAGAEPEFLVHETRLEGAPGSSLLELVAAADAVVVGPGLGRGEGRRALVAGVLGAAHSAVVDADALVAFAGALPELVAAAGGSPLLLTPHPGEFRMLAPAHAAALEVDPWQAAEAAVAGLGGVAILLKGVPTVIAESRRATLSVAAGNPGLATGGSGDTLSGLAGACLAAGVPAGRSGAVAAQALGRAADLAARRVTARALRPTDVANALPDVWRAWEARRRVPPPPRPPILLSLPAPALT